MRSLSRIRLSVQLAALFALLIGAIAIVLLVYIPQRFHAQAHLAAQAKATSMAEMAAFSVSAALLFDDARGAEEALAGLMNQPEFVRVVVRDARGRQFLNRTKRTAEAHDQLVTRVPVTSGSDRIGELEVSMSLADVHAGIRAGRKTTATFIAILFASGLAGALAISLAVTRPLKRIADAANAISSGDLTRRVEPEGSEEIADLAHAFNTMVGGVQVARDELQALNRSLETNVADRTRQLRIEVEERQQLASELRLILQSTYDGVLALDESGRCTLANDSALKSLGRESDAVDGVDLHQLLHQGTCTGSCELEAALVNGERRSLTSVLVRATGENVAAEISVAPLRHHDRDHGAVMTFRDVTEREHLRRQLEDAERVSSLGRLAAMMAHEFNNVLMGIQPFVDIIRRSGSKIDRVAAACQSISQSVKRGKRVTEEVLRYTRPRDPRRAAIDAAAWLTEAAGAFRVTLPESIHVSVVPNAQPIAIAADREQIDQVLANLAMNARDAMPDGGRMTLSVDRDGSFAHFRVADTGHGMTPDALPRIFEPFFTTKRTGGTGLGLPVAQQIVERHGGSLYAESAYGEGSVFHFLLPLADAGAVVDASPAGAVLSRPCRVLLVEDDDAVAAGIQAVLDHAGHEIVVASSGRDAKRRMAFFRADVVVLDVGLPDTDGITLYSELAADRPNLPVVFSTGHGDSSKLQHLLSRPYVAFLQKPYASEDLVSQIGRVMALRAGAVV